MFEKYRDRFLVYGCVCSVMVSLQEFLADQMANNQNIRLNVLELEKQAKVAAATKNRFVSIIEPNDFLDLASSLAEERADLVEQNILGRARPAASS